MKTDCNTESDYTHLMYVVDGKALSQFLKSISALVNDCRLTLNVDGSWLVCQADAAKTTLIRAELSNEDCINLLTPLEHTVTIGLADIGRFKPIIAKIGKFSSVIVVFKKEVTHQVVRFMIGLMEFSFTTNDYVTVPKSRKVPDICPSDTFTVAGVHFKEHMKRVMKYTCTDLWYHDRQLTLISRNIDEDETNSSKYTVEVEGGSEDFRSNLGMTFLKPTVKSLPNTDVTLYLGNDMNVAFKIETPKGSSMMYYIAPRVERKRY